MSESKGLRLRIFDEIHAKSAEEPEACRPGRGAMKTRAQENGFKPGILARQAKRRLAKAKELIAAAVAPYEDVDSGLERDGRDLIGHVDELAEAIDRTTDWLNEPVEPA